MRPDAVRGIVSHMEAERAPDLEQNTDGVDLTLVRWMLSLSPVERVEYIESIAESIAEIRELNRER